MVIIYRPRLVSLLNNNYYKTSVICWYVAARQYINNWQINCRSLKKKLSAYSNVTAWYIIQAVLYTTNSNWLMFHDDFINDEIFQISKHQFLISRLFSIHVNYKMKHIKILFDMLIIRKATNTLNDVPCALHERMKKTNILSEK